MDNYCLAHIDEFNRIIWGANEVRPDVFQRWCQGFSFSQAEFSALIQTSGGPCAIIATAQAAILCEVMFIRQQNVDDITGTENMDLLLISLSKILALVLCKGGNAQFHWVYWTNEGDNDGGKSKQLYNSHIIGESMKEPEQQQKQHQQSDSRKITDSDFQAFIKGLRCYQTESADELFAVALSLLPQLQSSYGVLCFLYSVLYTHGLKALKSELADDLDPLIEPIHGHSSQSLINLLITGECTPYLFDGERDLGGYTLKGITCQPTMGFLTYFEALRYCEVGWFLKNPSYPVWILGSETHLTVLASPELSLVSKNQVVLTTTAGTDSGATTGQVMNLRKVDCEFKRLSPDDDSGGFISSTDLQNLLENLDVNNNSLNMEELIKVLDPEGLGIILKNDFLLHFFPDEATKHCSSQCNFKLIHYNGLEYSNLDGKVCYHIGEAQLIDPTDELVENQPVDQSPIQQCLATKWPTIRIKWDGDRVPSLN